LPFFDKCLEKRSKKFTVNAAMNRRPLWPLRSVAPNSRNLRQLRLLFWLVSVIGCAACRTLPPLATANLSEPGWSIREGQAVWRPKLKGPEIAGELLVATHRNGETFLQFTKTPLPLVVVRTTTNRWHIEFIAEHRARSGHGQPPAQFGWLQLARCVGGAAPLTQWHWEKFPDDRWRLENRVSGETFEGFLTP
jgi:hypothetical protein